MVLSTDERVLEYARFSGGVDRAELARELDLPQPTVVSSVRRLLAAGRLLAVDQEQGRAARGPGRHLLRASGPHPLLGLVGWRGGRVHATLYDTDQQPLAAAQREAPAPRSGPEGLVGIIDELVAQAARRPDAALHTVVVSVPAPFLRGKGAPREHSTLHDLPRGFHVTNAEDFDGYLGGRFGLAVITENDANLAALGEQYARTERIDNAIYLTVGDDGIGSAVIANGRLARGAHGYGGEIAHLQLDRNGPLCHCGGRGCLWMRVRELTLPASADLEADPINLSALARLSEGSDPGAQRVLADIGRMLGRPLGHLSTFLDPEVIIVEATLGAAVDHIIGGIAETFAVEAPPVIARNVRLERSSLGNTAEVRGAFEIAREAVRRA
ncbi:MAG TPA: ROK family protein [Propionibacteriaceae bacterium]|nr:ROK family protein [Propionibacteriaceae bacterium]